MLTLWCIAVVCGSCLLVGVPVRWLLTGRAPLDQAAWIEAPFLGIAVIVLFTQNLVYLDVRVAQSTWWLWGIVALLWGWMSGQGAVRPTLRAFPVSVFAAALAALVVQGLGLLLAGARHYYGRAWGDQFNYTAMAQFLTDWPFSTTLGDLGHHPYVAAGLRFKFDRIGQSVLQGFFSTTAAGDAMLLFEPTILLSPFLVVLAVYAVSRRYGLSARTAVISGFCAAVLPAMAMVHLESFLSQALATPFLLYAPVAIDELAHSRRPARIAITALLMAAAVSVYSELLVVMLALAAMGLLLSRSHAKWRLRVLTLVVLVLAIGALNARFTFSLLRILLRLDLPILGHLYPWALSVEGIVRVWFGDLGAAAHGLVRPLVRAAALTFTALGYYGLVRAAVIRIGGPAAAAATSGRAFPLLPLAIAVLPAVLFARDDEHPYQFYKLLLTTAPVLTVGVALALQRLASLDLPAPADGPHRHKWAIPTTVAAAWTLVAVGALAGTAAMTAKTASTEPSERSNAHYLRQADVRALMEQLSNTRGERILFSAYDETWNHGLLNAWIAYFARHHEVWLENRMINDVDLSRWPALRDVVALDRLPPGVLVLTIQPTPLPASVGVTATRIWTSGQLELWRTSRSWVYPLSLDNPNGLDGDRERPTYWLGGGSTRLRLIASADGEMHTIVDASLPERAKAAAQRVRVTTRSGERIVTLSPGLNVFEIPVRAGPNDIALEPLVAASPPMPGQDQRPLVVGLRDPRFTLERDWIILSRIENPNGVENEEGKPFFWMGGGPTRLELWSGSAGMVEVALDAVLGPSIPNDVRRHIRVESDEGVTETVDTVGGPVRFRLPIGAGKRTVTLTPLDPPAVVIPQDPRPLVVGIRNLTVTPVRGGRPVEAVRLR